MLIELIIENFGIIEHVRLRMGSGFNVITGETGAGKSLILQAMDAVTGARVGSGVVRNGASRASVEATFDTSRTPPLRAWLEKNGFSTEDRYLTIRREIAVDGRGRASINGASARLHQLRHCASWLLEIHGQHDNQHLLDPETHIDSLDQFAGLMDQRENVGALYYKYHRLKKRLKTVTLEAGEKERRLDYLRYALEEIEAFKPELKEYDELEQWKAVIQNSGKLYRDFSGAYSMLREEDQSILDRVNLLDDTLVEHTTLHPGLEEKVQDLREAIYRLELLSDYLREEKEKIQFSPEKLEDVEERLEGYKKLHKKFGGSTGSVIQAAEDYRREIDSIEMSEEEAELLRSEIQILHGELMDASEDLSTRRLAAIPLLEERLASELEELGMAGARIQISVNRELESEGEHRSYSGGDQESQDHGHAWVINERGLDRVEFYLQANAGEKLLPLRKVASGGELSRVMLAMKSTIMENRPVGTVIFDEVDSGVGGEIAHAIGARLKKISIQSQVLVVTHLHQIASTGDTHFRIFKQLREGRTVTNLQHLDGENRMRELARMLGGESSGSAVLEHARELLKRQAASA